MEVGEGGGAGSADCVKTSQLFGANVQSKSLTKDKALKTVGAGEI